MTKKNNSLEGLEKAVEEHGLAAPLPPEQERHLARLSDGDRQFAAHVLTFAGKYAKHAVFSGIDAKSAESTLETILSVDPIQQAAEQAIERLRGAQLQRGDSLRHFLSTVYGRVQAFEGQDAQLAADAKFMHDYFQSKHRHATKTPTTPSK